MFDLVYKGNSSPSTWVLNWYILPSCRSCKKTYLWIVRLKRLRSRRNLNFLREYIVSIVPVRACAGVTHSALLSVIGSCSRQSNVIGWWICVVQVTHSYCFDKTNYYKRMKQNNDGKFLFLITTKNCNVKIIDNNFSKVNYFLSFI